ncbi:MAG: IS21 family transposase [Rhodospirillaceae bacterium]|nr:MAG: IS21 family transposase [Rhodospirillaceae bacterium]
MYSVDIYNKVRLACHRNGLSQREAARQFGVCRKTIKKMLSHAEPPGYRRKDVIRRPKLDGFTNLIDQILKDDQACPKKQRHTAKRIFERLCDEYGFTGKRTIVADYVRRCKQRNKEVFVPLSHDPGHAQVDFGEALAVIGGVEQKVHYLAMSLPHSDGVFIKAYPRETTEAFCDGHVAAFAFFGGVPLSIVYDNTKIAVARILGGGKRVRTQTFTRLQSHYLFQDKFGRPARGNDKGKVEGMVGFARRNFMVPIPRFATYDDLNIHLEQCCLKRQNDTPQRSKQTIGEKLLRDLDGLMALPRVAFDPCETVATRVNSLSMVRYRSNDYSVPTAYGHREVQVRGYVDRVVIACGADIIAQHKRSYDKDDMVFDPLHYLALLEQKIGALDQAAPLKNWDLPAEFATLYRLLERRMGKKGKREFVQVLRLMETFAMDDVNGAIKQALNMGAIGYDAIKHLVLCRVDKRPPKLNMDIYPFLPKATVGTTNPASYMTLLGAVQ